MARLRSMWLQQIWFVCIELPVELHSWRKWYGLRLPVFLWAHSVVWKLKDRKVGDFTDSHELIDNPWKGSMTPLSLSGRVPVQNQCSTQTKLHIKFAAFCPPMAGHHQLFARQWSAMANEPDLADIISFLSMAGSLQLFAISQGQTGQCACSGLHGWPGSWSQQVVSLSQLGWSSQGAPCHWRENMSVTTPWIHRGGYPLRLQTNHVSVLSDSSRKPRCQRVNPVQTIVPPWLLHELQAEAPSEWQPMGFALSLAVTCYWNHDGPYGFPSCPWRMLFCSTEPKHIVPRFQSAAPPMAGVCAWPSLRGMGHHWQTCRCHCMDSMQDWLCAFCHGVATNLHGFCTSLSY